MKGVLGNKKNPQRAAWQIKENAEVFSKFFANKDVQIRREEKFIDFSASISSEEMK